jgi:hypothetical protein
LDFLSRSSGQGSAPMTVLEKKCGCTVSVHNEKITIDGAIDGSSYTYECLSRDLGKIHGDSFIISAEEASIRTGGADTWMKLVDRFFSNATLRYEASQLSCIMELLKADGKYAHSLSTFDEDI